MKKKKKKHKLKKMRLLIEGERLNENTGLMEKISYTIKVKS